MRTPIDHVKEDVRDQDAMQYRLVGTMCLIFGGCTLFGILIPNPIYGRLSFSLSEASYLTWVYC